jgi:hypothetical protein
MRTIYYLWIGGVLLFVFSFGAGVWYDRYTVSQSAIEGTIVARDASSITLRLADDTTTVVPLDDRTAIFAQASMPVTPQFLATGQDALVTISEGKASFVRVTSQMPPNAQPQ